MKKQLFKLALSAILLFVSKSLVAQNAPDAPSGFTATPSSTAYKIDLSWSDNSDNETRFIIYKEWIDEFVNSADIILTANTTSYVDTEVQPNVAYHYSLWSENDFGPSAEVYADATPTRQTPPAPANFSVVTGPLTSIQVSFTDNSNSETGYQIQHATDPDQSIFESYVIPGDTMGDLVTTFVKNYPHNFTVYIRVRAFTNDNGTYIYGPFTPLLSTTTDDYPAEPSNFNSSVEGNDIRLSWSDNATNESAYIMVRYIDEYNPNFNTAFRLPANTTTFLDTTAHEGISYTYRLQPIDVYEDVPDHYFFTEGRFVETSGIISSALPAPYNLHGGAYSPNDILFAYRDNSSNETGFEVHYSTISSSGPFDVKWLEDEDPDYDVNLGGLHGFEPNTTVYFKVRAVLISPDYLDTLYSNFSNLAVVETLSEEVPEAPLALLATYVTPTSFIANWEPVEFGDHYELYVFSINDSIPLTGYNGVEVWGTSLAVSGTRPSKRYAYYVRAINDEEFSENSNTIRVSIIKNLTLRTVCSDNPSVYRRWKVINNNPVPVQTSWQLTVTGWAGNHLATTGESFFTTPTVAGSNRITLYWTDDKEQLHSSVKTSTYKACANDSARAYVINEDSDIEEITFSVVAYPNSITDIFHLVISSETNEDVQIEIINLQGERVHSRSAKVNTDIEINASTYAPGLYLVNARQVGNHKTIKILKE